MAESVDASQGWCCDGRTYAEHAGEDGDCCQPAGTSMDELSGEAREKARERLNAST
jgi:hypothetical protein